MLKIQYKISNNDDRSFFEENSRESWGDEEKKKVPVATTAGLIDPTKSAHPLANILTRSKKTKRTLYICTCVHKKYALYIRCRESKR